jgi:hypothetical protein
MKYTYYVNVTCYLNGNIVQVLTFEKRKNKNKIKINIVIGRGTNDRWEKGAVKEDGLQPLFFFLTFTHSQRPVFLHNTTSVVPFVPPKINWLFKHNKDMNGVFGYKNV